MAQGQDKPERGAAKTGERESISDAERLAEAGVQLEAVIHRINNPLASLLLSLSQLAEHLARGGCESDPAAALRTTLEARSDGERVASAVRELRSLFPSDAPRRVDALAVLNEVLDLLGQQRGVRITRHFGVVLPVFVREARFAQVLRSAGQLVIDALSSHRAEEITLRVEAEEIESELRVRIASEGPASRGLTRSLLPQSPSQRLSFLRGMVHQLGGALELRDRGLDLSSTASSRSISPSARVFRRAERCAFC
jgi:C4-dicarboxylate-specific signal transduction histidine kinase